MRRILDRFWAWLIARCQHHPGDVMSDLLEGGGGDIGVRYCRRCGATAIVYGRHTVQQRAGAWRMPNPSWHYKGRQ